MIDNQFNNSPIPLIVETINGKPVPVDLFSRMITERKLYLRGPIENRTMEILSAQLLYLEREKKPIQLWINSPGGDVQAGLAIIDMMNLVENPIHTIVVGQAASMAAVIAACGEPEKRAIMPNASMMLHEPSLMIGGKATDVRSRMGHIEKLEEVLMQTIAAKTGKDPAHLKEVLRQDVWFTSQEALEFGLVDKITGEQEAQ